MFCRVFIICQRLDDKLEKVIKRRRTDLLKPMTQRKWIEEVAELNETIWEKGQHKYPTYQTNYILQNMQLCL